MQALSIQGLHKVYPGKQVALKGIDLSISPGEFFALLGPNGAGKSTAIGIIASLINKTTGQIKVFGYNLGTPRAKSTIGLVPQELNFNLFEHVIDVLIYQAGYYGVPFKIAEQRAEYYLKKLVLWDKRHQACMRLSGGMKRRLMIARAFMHEPKLLILDEPTAGVDIEIRNMIWAFLKEVNSKGTTIILTTHYLEEAENLCQKVAVIDQGSIITHTSMQHLLGQLRTETFIFDLTAPLMTLPPCEPFNLRVSDDRQHIEADITYTQNLNELFAFFQTHAIYVRSMRNKTNRLEALFLDLITENQFT